MADNPYDEAVEQGDARTVAESADSVRSALLMTLELTGRVHEGGVIPYSHDHFDRAMYDLDRLVRMARQVQPS